MIKLSQMEKMLELASLGAGVMHNRSIEFAKKFSVPIHVRSSFTDIPGTMIVSMPEASDSPVSGAAVTRDEARVTVAGVPDVPGASLKIFSRIADRSITMDMIVQNVGEDGKADISKCPSGPENGTVVWLQVRDQQPTHCETLGLRHWSPQPYECGNSHVPRTVQRRDQCRNDQHQ